MEKPLPPPPRVELDEQLLRWLNQLPNLIPNIQEYVFVLDPASINGSTASTQSFTASGLVSADSLLVTVSLTSGLRLYANAKAPADDRLELEFQNTTGGAIDQASTTFHVITIR